MKKSITWKQFGAIFLVLVGIILAFSPVEYGSENKADAETIAKLIVDREDHVTAEQLGHLIIDKDPDYLLIDVRKVQEFTDFHIKTAINIPLEEIFKPEYLTSLDPEKFIILYSNGGTHAAQAWVMLRQKGLNNTAVLLGGLNYWVDVYSNPTPPENVHADSEVFRYQFLKSAGPYLLGDGQVSSETAEPEKPMPVKPLKRKKKKKAADEGC
jgi:rhodanese-related sulfurtransferase